MCSHAGHSNTKAPVARISMSPKHVDAGQWMGVMQKSHQLAHQRQQQEAALDIQQEVEIKKLIYPQGLIALKQSVKALGKNQTLKIKTASQGIKRDLAAAARILQCHIEDVMNEQYLYLTKI